MGFKVYEWAKNVRTHSIGEKAVLLALASYADDAGYCWPSQDRLAWHLTTSTRTVQRHIKALKKAGIITTKTRGQRLHYMLNLEMSFDDSEPEREDSIPDIVSGSSRHLDVNQPTDFQVAGDVLSDDRRHIDGPYSSTGARRTSKKLQKNSSGAFQDPVIMMITTGTLDPALKDQKFTTARVEALFRLVKSYVNQSFDAHASRVWVLELADRSVFDVLVAVKTFYRHESNSHKRFTLPVAKNLTKPIQAKKPRDNEQTHEHLPRDVIQRVRDINAKFSGAQRLEKLREINHNEHKPTQQQKPGQEHKTSEGQKSVSEDLQEVSQ